MDSREDKDASPHQEKKLKSSLERQSQGDSDCEGTVPAKGVLGLEAEHGSENTTEHVEQRAYHG